LRQNLKELEEKNYFDIVREGSGVPKIVASIQGQKMSAYLVEQLDRELTPKQKAGGERHESKPASNVIASKLRIAKVQSTSRSKHRQPKLAATTGHEDTKNTSQPKSGP
jgi:hypothetical protein